MENQDLEKVRAAIEAATADLNSSEYIDELLWGIALRMHEAEEWATPEAFEDWLSRWAPEEDVIDKLAMMDGLALRYFALLVSGA